MLEDIIEHIVNIFGCNVLEYFLGVNEVKLHGFITIIELIVLRDITQEQILIVILIPVFFSDTFQRVAATLKSYTNITSLNKVNDELTTSTSKVQHRNLFIVKSILDFFNQSF